MKTARFIVVLLLLSINASFAQTSQPSDVRRDDDEQLEMLEAGANLLRAKRPADAIAQSFDPAIAAYEARYRNQPEHVYCADNSVETLAYLTKHAAEKKTPAIVVRGWCDALYLKGYALVELKRFAEAKKAIEAALALSPSNSQYLSELGHIYQVERDWPKAIELYRAAEQGAQLSSPEAKNPHLARAQRGVGFVLIELGRLDEAEAKFRQSLEIDKDNAIAKYELEYIRKLRAKPKI